MVKHILKITLGILLVLIGIIGGLIPIFQGWVFGIPGMIILAEYFPPIKKVLNWAKKKYKAKKRPKYPFGKVFNFSPFWFDLFLM